MKDSIRRVSNGFFPFFFAIHIFLALLSVADADLNLEDLQHTSKSAPVINCSDVEGDSEEEINKKAIVGSPHPDLGIVGEDTIAVVWSNTTPTSCVLYSKIKMIEEDAADVLSSGVIDCSDDRILELPSIVGLPGGSMGASWTRNGVNKTNSSVFFRMMNSENQWLCGATRAREHDLANQTFESYSHCSGLAEGNLAVVWIAYNDTTTSESEIYLRLFHSDLGCTPAGPQVLVREILQLQRTPPDVAALDDGSFVIVFDKMNHSQSVVVAIRYNSVGIEIGNEIAVGSVKFSNQMAPSVAGLGADGFVVVWQYSSNKIYAQVFNDDCEEVGNEILVTQPAIYAIRNPFVSAFREESFIVLWECDMKLYAIRGRIFSSYDNVEGGELDVNNITDGTQRYPHAVAFDENAYAVVWERALTSVDHNVVLRLFRCYSDEISSSTGTSSSSSSHSIPEDGLTTFLRNLVSYIMVSLISLVVLVVVIFGLIVVICTVFLIALVFNIFVKDGNRGFSSLDNADENSSYNPPDSL